MIGQEARSNIVRQLLPRTKHIRNVSIVAHVDHGKTTLADCLIASNGIIHRKQAGQLKLMDDRLDEQDRGITMKSSSISLVHKDHLINLIDSPGHLQFYSEVSAALRLTDSALLVVDTVEGVSSQTFRVLQQLYTQKLPAILVLNKIDKLVTHCKMDPLQAFQHLSQLIEHVNAILGSFIAKQIHGQKLEDHKSNESKTIDKLESHFYFSPQKKNVVFASSLDNWGFSIQNFSPLIAKKLGKKPEEIQKYLWGEYYFNPKTKTFSTQPRNENDQPVCVDLIIKQIWDIFENVYSQNFEKIDKIIKILNLKISPSALKAKSDPLIREVLNSWLPLDRLIMDRIVSELPSPVQAQKFRLPYLLQLNSREHQLPLQLQEALQTCSTHQEAPLIAFISKMITIPRKNINEKDLPFQTGGDPELPAMGFGRIFSGRLRRGQEVLLIGCKPKKVQDEHGQMKQVPDITKTKISGLYFFNGQYPQGIEEAYGGCVVGIGGLQNDIFKSGTISTSQDCLSFVPVSSQTKSILKVSVSTPDIKCNPQLLEGLKRLNRSDPSVDVYVQSTGDIILNTCGQVHLEKCVVDMENIYCKIPIKISDPIITFKETITWQTLKQIKNEKYLIDIQKKRRQQEKKQMKEAFKAEMLADAELDELQKEKQRAVREWDSHVEIYNSEDLTVEDTRFFFKNRDDINEDEETFVYKRQKQLKKLDHKNRGKMHAKQKFLNLNLKTNLANLRTPNLKVSIKMRALGMPFAIAQFLQKNIDKMLSLMSHSHKIVNNQNKINKQKLAFQRKEYFDQFLKVCKQQGMEEEIKQLILKKMVCFGPNPEAGTNILLIQQLQSQPFFEQFLRGEQQNQIQIAIDQQLTNLLEEYKTTTAELIMAIKNGFCFACTSGPLANEQLMGVIFLLEQIKAVEDLQQEKTQSKEENDKKESDKESQAAIEKNQKNTKEMKEEKNEDTWLLDNFGPLAGQIISTVKDSCIQSFLGGSPRLVEPMYLCELHTDQQYYGSIYNELSKRRAQVISQDLHQFSNFFIIKAYLPMLQSHNFCFSILDRTQGTVNAQLDLDTWKIIDQDPFFVPQSMEEIEENGVDKNMHNQARKILEMIRQKKGLAGCEKIVVAAEKQRTLKKN